MKRTTLFLLAVTTASCCLFAQTTKNPFSELGYKKQITYTSSKGEFEEFHDNADVVEIGSVYFNTKTNKVVGYVNEEKENAEVATATSAMSVDPLCEKYYWVSPYVFCMNNPVNLIDPDGRDWIVANDTYKFEWRDDINAKSKMPDGYTYVGSQNNDILSYMGLKTSYPDANTNSIGMVGSDAELGKFAVSHLVNVQENSSLDLSANVSLDKKNKSDNNADGRTFNGIDITVTNVSSNSGVDGELTSKSMLTVEYGKEKASFALKDPNYTSLHQQGTTVNEGTAFVPAHILAPNTPFSVQVKGNWWVYNNGQRTPVVVHGLVPAPKAFLHKWKLK